MRILVLSDIHGTSLENANDIASDYDLVLIAGDITHFGGYAAANDVLYSLIKNHDVRAVFGNCDNIGVGEYLDEQGISVHNKASNVNGFIISGFSGAPISPFRTPGEFEDEKIGAGIVIATGKRTIILTHVPAYGTKLDISHVGHIGSRSVYDFIQKYQPDLHICGHVHEARGADKIGKTLLLNPGPYFKGYYADVLINDTIEYAFKSF